MCFLKAHTLHRNFPHLGIQRLLHLWSLTKMGHVFRLVRSTRAMIRFQGFFRPAFRSKYHWVCTIQNENHWGWDSVKTGRPEVSHVRGEDDTRFARWEGCSLIKRGLLRANHNVVLVSPCDYSKRFSSQNQNSSFLMTNAKRGTQRVSK